MADESPMKTVEFLFDVGSPTTYLAWIRLPRITREVGAEILWTPVLLGGIFKATGNQSPVTVPAKGKWMLGDLARWAAEYGVPLHFNPHFPVNTMVVQRGAVALRDRPEFQDYLTSMFTAMWVGGQDLGDPAEVARAVERAGVDPKEFEALVADPIVKNQLRANTEEAVERGVFGCPTFFVGETMYFGQDRLDFVARALSDA
jgi:2-hydroxychromene-2-carboxylate isomerase